MKKLIFLLALVLAINFTFAEVAHSTVQDRAVKKTVLTKVEKLSASAIVKKLNPKHTKTTIGRYAMIGVLLIILGAALLFIPDLVKIIAATLIIMGVVLFVLDLIGMV